MTCGWTEAPLGEVCVIRPPKSEVRKRLSGTDPVSFVPMEDLGIGEKYFAARQTRALNEVDGSYTYFSDGDVLLAKITPCFENGKLGIARALTNSTGFGSSEFIVLRPSDKILDEYLYYYLSQKSFRDAGVGTMGGAVGQQRVDKDFVASHKIPLPYVPEQRRIVALLDTAFAAIAMSIANAEKNLANVQALFDASLQASFARLENGQLKKFPLSDLTDPNSPITYGVVKPGGTGDVIFVRGGDLLQGRVLIGQLRTITRAVSEQYRRTLLRGGELLICLVGQPGQVAVAPRELAGANIARQVGLIRLKASVDAEFVRYFLQSSTGRCSLGAKETGSVQQVINLGELRRVEVPIPSEGEQKIIVTKLRLLAEETDRLRAIYRDELLFLESLKQCILQRAFLGELKSLQSKAFEQAAE